MDKKLLELAEKIVKTVDEIAEYTIVELLKFYRSNNFSEILIDEEKIARIKETYSNYLFRKLEPELQVMISLKQDSGLKKIISKITEVVSQPDNFSGLGRLLKKNSDFIYSKEKMWGSVDSAFEEPKYDFDVLRYFSILDYIIEEIVEEIFHEPATPVNEGSNLFLLNEFDTRLYEALLKNPQLLQTLEWRQFEKLLKQLLEVFEYEVELMSGTKDGGIDIIAIKNDSYFGVHRYILQAKRWKNKVGIEPIRQLAFLQSHIGASKACLVTTSQFTSGAWQLAGTYKWQLELKDHQGLLDWIRLANEIKRIDR